MMARFGSMIGVTCAIALLVAIAPGPSAAGEANITHPHLIVCDLKGARYFLYLNRIDTDGTATYMTPTKQVLKVTAGGVLSRGGQVGAEGNCIGKTLEELRAAGQTFSFKE
jgi:hypothetical protein